MEAKRPQHILLVEDNPGDAHLIHDHLSVVGDGRYHVDVSGRLDEALHVLQQQKVDVILLDLNLPDSSGLDTLHRLRTQDVAAPIVVLTGLDDTRAALTAVSYGAQDYLIKGEISSSSLRRAISYAVERHRLAIAAEANHRQLAQSEAFARSVLSSLSATLAVLDEGGVILAVNDGWRQFAAENRAPDGLINGVGINYLTVCASAAQAGDQSAAVAMDGIQTVLRGQQNVFTLEYPCHSPHGQRWFLMRVTPLAGAIGGVVVAHEEVTELKIAELSRARALGRLEILHEIDSAILKAQSAEEIATAALVKIVNLLDVGWGNVVLFDFASRSLTLLAQHGAQQAAVAVGNVAPLDAFCGDLDILRQGRPWVVTDSGRCLWSSDNRQTTYGCPRRGSCLRVPLTFRDNLLGALTLAAGEPDAITREHIEVAQEVASQLVVALRQAHLVSALRSSEQRFRSVIEQSAEGIALVDEEGTIIVWNKSQERITGLATAEVVGSPFWQVLEQLMADSNQFPELEAEAQQFLAEVQQKGLTSEITTPIDLVFRRSDGSPRFAQILVFPIATGRGYLLCAITHDITEQKEAAERNIELLRETERLLQQTQRQARQVQGIMDAVPEGVVLLDAHYRILSANRVAESLLAELGHANGNDRLTQFAGRTLAPFLEEAAAGAPWHELQAENGRRIFELGASPMLLDDRGEGWVLVLRDVTQQRTHEEYLQNQERLATVGQLAAGIAHDFNNIMAIITLLGEMLLREPQHARREAYMTTITEQARYAASLVGQILDFSRRSVMERRPLDLHPFVNEAVKLFRRTLPENISVTLSAQPGHYMVNADPTRLQQVMMNLVVNARDAMPQGGDLQLLLERIAVDDESTPPLPGIRAGEWITLAVIDNGNGIAPEAVKHLFEPFFTTKTDGKGTGLGLAQVYGLVKQHGGEIDVASREGSGTTVTIYLPSLQANPEPEPAQETAHSTTGGGETILVVEDNEMARKAIVDVLGELNYHVLVAGNGKEALALFAEHEAEVELVISDLMMPVMDGATLYGRLKVMRPGIKVIFMTGYRREDMDPSLREEDNVTWLQKPFTIERIAKTVCKMLDAKCDYRLTGGPEMPYEA